MSDRGASSCKSYSIIPLPESIDKGSFLAPYRFVKTNSRLVDSTGFDSKTTGELTRLLLAVLSRDFGLTCCPGVNLVREPTMAKQAKGS